MKKLRYFMCSLLALLIFMPTVAYADIGPKPSVRLKLSGIPESTCYVTLLSRDESTGPYSVSSDPIWEDSWLVEDDRETGMEAWQAFRDYHDPDGYYFIEYFEKCEKDEDFLWDYFPPENFKVLIYLPESEMFLTSGVAERYAFDSCFSVHAKNMLELRVRKDYQYGWELISLAARIVATILLEVLIALLFHLWNKRILMGIFLTNVLTQILLNVLLNVINYHSGSWAFMFHYIWMELAVFAIEALVYKFLFTKNGVESPYKWLTYAATANALSFAAGLALARMIPGIF